MKKELVIRKICDKRIAKLMEKRLTAGTVNQIVNMWDIKVSHEEISFYKGEFDDFVIETLELRYPRMIQVIKESDLLKPETKTLLGKRVEEIMEFLIKELRKEDEEYDSDKFLESIKWF